MAEPFEGSFAQAIGYYPAFGLQPETAWFIAEKPLFLNTLQGDEPAEVLLVPEGIFSCLEYSVSISPLTWPSIWAPQTP
jgi:hypothetical protein